MGISENYVDILQFEYSEYSSSKAWFAYAKIFFFFSLENHWILIKLHSFILSWIWTMKLSWKALYISSNPSTYSVQGILSCQNMEFCSGIRKWHDILYSSTKFDIQIITYLHAALVLVLCYSLFFFFFIYISLSSQRGWRAKEGPEINLLKRSALQTCNYLLLNIHGI